MGNRFKTAVDAINDRLPIDVTQDNHLVITLPLVILAVVPIAMTESQTVLLSQILIFGIFAIAFDLLYGYSGIVSFGQSLFYGGGAYAVAMTSVYLGIENIWLLIFLGIIVCSAAGFVIGYISIRTTGVYFAILTLAWALIGFILVERSSEITGGDDGMLFSVSDIVLVPGVVEFSIAETLPFYYLVFTFLAFTLFFSYRLVNSPMGSVLKGVRENQERINYLGYSQRWYRILIFTISAGLSGLAGALGAMLIRFVAPSYIEFILSGEVIVWSILGGTGTIIGALIGAGLVVFAENQLSAIFSWWFIPVGIIFIAVVIVFPDGLVGFIRRLYYRES